MVKLEKERAERRLKRWQLIGLEAAKQSQRSYLPEVEELTSWTEALKKLSRFDLVIGPEGGFSKEEIDDLLSLGAKVVSLGKQILRTETAAIATLTAVLYHFGRLGG